MDALRIGKQSKGNKCIVGYHKSSGSGHMLPKTSNMGNVEIRIKYQRHNTRLWNAAVMAWCLWHRNKSEIYPNYLK